MERGWKDEIYEKLIETFAEDPDSFQQIDSILMKEEEKYFNSSDIGPTWRKLRSALRIEGAFKQHALLIIKSITTNQSKNIAAEQNDANCSTSTERNINWKDQIYRKLRITFANNIESFLRIYLILAEEDRNYANNDEIGPTWHKLKSTLEVDDAFDLIAQQIVQSTGNTQNPEFQVMSVNKDMSWKDEIRSKLREILANEDLLLINDLLADEERKCSDSDDIGPTWRNLKSLLKIDNAFKHYIEEIIDNIRTDVHDHELAVSVDVINGWKDQIYRKLNDLFSDDIETLVRFKDILAAEERNHYGDIGPMWHALKSTLMTDREFIRQALRMAEDIKAVQPHERPEHQSQWKDQIYQKLNKIFEHDVENLVKIHMLLADEERECLGSDRIGSTWRVLRSFLKPISTANNTAFERYARQVVEDKQQDEKFRRTMMDLYMGMMTPNDKTGPADKSDRLGLIKPDNQDLTTTSAWIGFGQAIAKMPVELQLHVMEKLPTFDFGKSKLIIVRKPSYLHKQNGNILAVGLALVYLSWETITNLRLWFSGKITGERCLINILSDFSSMVGTVGGGFAGTYIGSLFGPVGSVIGGMVGSILGGNAAKKLADELMREKFGVPKDVALENAYKYFGVQMDASNNEINSAFRKKCLQHHPDKGGNKEEFFKVQTHMAHIKLARGEM